MLGKILCKIGLHDWITDKFEETLFDKNKVKHEILIETKFCKRCDKEIVTKLDIKYDAFEKAQKEAGKNKPLTIKDIQKAIKKTQEKFGVEANNLIFGGEKSLGDTILYPYSHTECSKHIFTKVKKLTKRFKFRTVPCLLKCNRCGIEIKVSREEWKDLKKTLESNHEDN